MYRERRLPPSEAQRILARALELQRAHGGGREMGDEELASTLHELGVEERFVQQALGDETVAAADVSTKASAFFGSPLKVALEQHVARVVDAADHPRLVEMLRRVVSEDGQSEVVGDELGFTLRSGRGDQQLLRVRVKPSPDGTTIRVEENLRAVAGGLFGGLLGALGANALLWSVLGPLVFHAPLWLPALLLGTWLAVWSIVRASFGAYVRGRRARLAEIVEKVAAEAASDTQGPAVRLATAARTRVSTDEAIDETEDEVRSRGRLRG